MGRTTDFMIDDEADGVEAQRLQYEVDDRRREVERAAARQTEHEYATARLVRERVVLERFDASRHAGPPEAVAVQRAQLAAAVARAERAVRETKP